MSKRRKNTILGIIAIGTIVYCIIFHVLPYLAYRRLNTKTNSFLSLVPKDVEWPQTSEGEWVSFGAYRLRLQTDKIEKIHVYNGIVLIFIGNTHVRITLPLALERESIRAFFGRDNDDEETLALSEIQDVSEKAIIDYDTIAAALKTTPYSFWAYNSMNKAQRDKHIVPLMIKMNYWCVIQNARDIYIYSTSNNKGFCFCVDSQFDHQYQCRMWFDDSHVIQEIIASPLDEETFAILKNMVASMEILIEDFPPHDELVELVEKSCNKLPWYQPLELDE